MRKNWFRAMANGSWTSGSLIEYDDGTYITFNAGNAVYTVPVDRNTVCRFTGASDKDSNAIFEGDVLRAEYPDGGKEYFLVKWCEPMCKFVMVDSKYGHHETLYKCSEDVEIIGDIFENPELKEWFDA